MVLRSILVITLCYSLVWAINTEMSSPVDQPFIDVKNPEPTAESEDTGKESKGFSIKLEQKKLAHPHKLSAARQE